MRLRKADLRVRVNGPLTLRFRETALTSYAGLELFRQYVSKLPFRRWMRSHLERRLPASDFGPFAVLMLLVTLIVGGGRRVRQVEYLKNDPVVERCCGMKRAPTSRTISRWLRQCTNESVTALLEVNDALVAERVREAGLKRLTLDIDGSVISTGLSVEGARRGFNPHQRKKPSYYPITAYESQTGQIVGLRNRPGNVHDGKASIQFLEDLIGGLRARLGSRLKLEFRMDGAYFRQDVLDLLDARRVDYAIKVPFWPWLGVKQRVAQRRRWWRLDASTSYFETVLKATPWNRYFRVIILRKHVRHRARKNYQLDLFDPSNGHYEYSAIATNKSLKPRALRAYMDGRGIHEKVYGELKHGFAFDSMPSLGYHANSAWQAISVLAFNLTRGFQAAATASPRRTNNKRRARHAYAHIQTLRYEYFHRAGVIRYPGGRATLDLGTTPAVTEAFSKALDRLRKPA